MTNDDDIERMAIDRLNDVANMLRECIIREIGRAQAKLATMHAMLLAGEFPAPKDSVRVEAFRIDDGFEHLYEKVHAIKRMKGES